MNFYWNKSFNFGVNFSSIVSCKYLFLRLPILYRYASSPPRR